MKQSVTADIFVEGCEWYHCHSLKSLHETVRAAWPVNKYSGCTRDNECYWEVNLILVRIMQAIALGIQWLL